MEEYNVFSEHRPNIPCSGAKGIKEEGIARDEEMLKTKKKKLAKLRAEKNAAEKAGGVVDPYTLAEIERVEEKITTITSRINREKERLGLMTR